MNQNIHSHIKDNFGRDGLKLFREYEKTTRKIASFNNHLTFNLKCLHEDLVPRSIQLTSVVKGHRAESILRNAEKKLINERIRQVNFNLDVLKNKRLDLSEELFCKFPAHEFDRVQEFCQRAQLDQHAKVKSRQIDKFNNLKLKQQSKADLDLNWRSRENNQSSQGNKEKWVKNISDRPLSSDEVSVLAKGINFSATPKKLPVVEIISATESAIKHSGLKQAEAEELRHKVCSNLVNSKLPRPNLTPGEDKALKTLAKEEDIVILPADKGKCVVVLNKKDYDSKCKELLKDTKTYKPLGYNPTSGYRKRVVDFVNELESEGTIDSNLKYKL